MAKGDIRLSKKHGVNPSVTVCAVCGKDLGVALFGRLKGDVEAPRKVFDAEPCDDCKTSFEKHIADGAFLFFVIKDEYESDTKRSPWPFFHAVIGIKKAKAKQMLKDVDMSHGRCFIPYGLAKMMGLLQTLEAK